MNAHSCKDWRHDFANRTLTCPHNLEPIDAVAAQVLRDPLYRGERSEEPITVTWR